MISVITNDAANRANNYARQNNSVIYNATERISSARFINRGSDNPSGLGIASGMKSRLGGLRMANANIQDAIGFLNLRDQAMAETGDILLRLKELAVRASNEATLTAEDLKKMNAEASTLIGAMNQINDDTKFNERKVFDTSFAIVPGGSFGFYTGGIKTASIDLRSIYLSTGAPVTLRFTWFDGAAAFPDANLLSPDGTEGFGWLYSPANGAPGVTESYGEDSGVVTITAGDVDAFNPARTMNSADSIVYSGWDPGVNAQGYFEETFVIDNPAAGLWTTIIDNEQPVDKLYGIFVNTPSTAPLETDRVQIGPDSDEATQAFRLTYFQVDSFALGVSASFTSATSSQLSLDSIDNAIQTLNTRRAEDGARVNKLMHVLDDNMAEIINVEAARSHIEDADMAQQITTLTKSQILSQSNASASIQANASPSVILDLIEEQTAQLHIIPRI